MVQKSGVAHPKQHPATKSAEQFLFSSASLRISSETHNVYRINSSHKSSVSSSAIMLTNSIPTSSTSQTNSQLPSLNTNDRSTTSPLNGISQCLSETAKERVASILHDVEKLSDVEKLYLYLQLPDGTTGIAGSTAGETKKKVNYPFGKKTDTEVVQAYTWIQSHLQEDSEVSTPKCEVYEDYKYYCEQNKFEKLCVADFGKAMRQMFPNVKPRRLGQRGNSKYCYSGLRKKMLVEVPELPLLDTTGDQQRVIGGSEGGRDCFPRMPSKSVFNGNSSTTSTVTTESPWSAILNWVEMKYKRKFTSTADCTRFLDEQEQQGCRFASGRAVTKFTAKTPPSIRKKELNNQLSSKKGHEKVKKCDMNGGELALSRNDGTSSTKCSGSVTSNFTVNNLAHQKNACSFSFNAANGSTNSPSQVKIKSEPTDDTLYKTKVPSNKCNKLANLPSSTLILLSPNQTSTASSALQQQNSLQSCLTKSPQMTPTSNPTISAVCTNGNGFPRYKTMQAKPGSLDLTQFLLKTECAPGMCSLQQALNADKRRHSVATPFNVEAVMASDEKCTPNDDALINFGSELRQLVNTADSDKNFKRSIEERDVVQFMAKKRHVEESATSMSNSPLLNNNNGSNVDNSDLRVNELETEALRDFLANNATLAFDNVTGGIQQQQQQLSPALNNADSNKDFTQIRKYLESSLPTFNQHPHHHHGGSPGAASLAKVNINGDGMNNNNSSNALNAMYSVDHSNSNSNMSLTPNSNNFNGGFNFNDTSSICAGGSTLDEIANCSLNSANQIPPSPNSRRLQFNFQPISPRDTPTIPENATLEMNMQLKQGSFGNNAGGFSGQATQMNSVAVGTSQPPSENNSPFISPRHTPNSMSRSRNNSGQSNYSNNNYRQTPMISGNGLAGGNTNCNNNFDSGVSSISSSPFISPHSTPVPCTARLINRLENGNNLSNSLRVRHSSGPGGPINRPVSNVMAYHRSNSLSPMIISDNYFLSNNNNNISNPSSYLNSLNSDLMLSKCNVVTQTDLKSGQEGQLMLPSFNSQLDNYPFLAKSQLRQRHFSNPYGAVNSNSALMKPETPGNATINSSNSPSNDESIKALLNRSQSVPLNPIFQTANSFDSISSLEGQYDNFGQLANAGTSNGGLSELDQTSPISKSYPSTPLCTNESFTLPHSSVGTSNSTTGNSNGSLEGSGNIFSGVNIDEFLTNDSDPIIQSGQDLIVSSVQITPGPGINEAGGVTSVNDELNVSSSPLTMSKAARDEYNDLLNDGLDNFNDGFPNCDTDFIGQSNTYDDVLYEYNK